MKANETFFEILKKKMQSSSNGSPQSQTTNVVDNIEIPFIFCAPIFVTPHHLCSYEKFKVKKEKPVLSQPPKPTEAIPFIILKSSLNDEEKSKWNLFEKMIGESLGEQVYRTQVTSAFRTFVKKIHPDLSEDNKKYNFATFVKIKNEFIQILEQKTKASSETTAK